MRSLRFTGVLLSAAIGVVISVVVVLSSVVSATAPEDLFKQGNEYYSQRQYDSALVEYHEVEQQGLESAALFFNMGNAYFRNGDIGNAMVYYLRAQRMAPDDDDIAANLEYARRYTTIQMEGVKLNPISTFFEELVGPYQLNTLAWISSIFFILLFALLIMRYGLVIRTAVVRTGIIVSLIFLLTASLLTTVKYNFDYLTRRGVIVAEQCVVRTGPSLQSDKELDAAPGLVVEILDESGDWYNVLFENKRRGWVRKDLVTVV